MKKKELKSIKKNPSVGLKKISLGKKVITKAKDKLPANKRPKPFPIAAFGASAGGVKAFTQVLENLDPTLGMAYVLIMHLSPNHKSALKEIMQSKTKMPVRTVKDGMEVMPNNVYVIPPGKYMSLVDGHLKLAPRSFSSLGNFAIDYFFTPLASIYKNNAIGIVLSGTATDGTIGLKAIKAEGGITFAQDDSAEFSGMPRNALEAGYVDFVLSPEAIAKELMRLVKTPYASLPPDKHVKTDVVGEDAVVLEKILLLVKQKSGIDFFLHYKHASIYRRVIRRVTLNKLLRIEEYYRMLRSNPVEVDALYNDFLINVTYFFRDQEFYKILTKQVFPAILKQAKGVEPIRIWTAGCATGEEAYSTAICLLDYLEKKNIKIPIQLFASDLDMQAIETARVGLYQASTLQQMPVNLVKRYFTKVNGQFQISKAVRSMCVFSQHNLLKDPPFSRIDLISCQNVLIYLETVAQKKVLQTFHYALKPTGFLFLGKSESAGAAADLFIPLNKKVKLFGRAVTRAPRLDFTIHPPEKSTAQTIFTTSKRPTLEDDMGKLLLSNYVYPSVVVNKNMVIVQFFGNVSTYIEPVTGNASLSILKMVREDLVIHLRSLLQRAMRTGKMVIQEAIQTRVLHFDKEVTIEVVPKKSSGELYFLVVFKEKDIVLSPIIKSKGSKKSTDLHERKITKLEEELVRSREVIRTTNEEYETTYEELQANSEEVLSSNEELQSVNEELETSKEELQSSNEELITINEELLKRNAELSDSQSTLKKVNEQMEQFAFISSHDLQEPLRKIETFSSLLTSAEANLNDYAKVYANKINTSASRMSKLIRDILSYSLIGHSETKKIIQVNLNDILKSVIEDFEVSIEQKNAKVSFTTLPILAAEPFQMTQLFHNLISNALRFSEEKPVIKISSKRILPTDYNTYPELKKDTEYVAISVQDNGMGFDQKYAAKVFLLFQKLGYDKNIEGTGIGLAICKKIVEEHKGFIYATSREKIGATFTVILPSS